MALQPAVDGRRDGFRDKLRELAEMCDEGAREQLAARRERLHQQQAMLHASIDAERLFENVADQLRKLRR